METRELREKILSEVSGLEIGTIRQRIIEQDSVIRTLKTQLACAEADVKHSVASISYRDNKIKELEEQLINNQLDIAYADRCNCISSECFKINGVFICATCNKALLKPPINQQP